jgi:hypothetical protein
MFCTHLVWRRKSRFAILISPLAIIEELPAPTALAVEVHPYGRYDWESSFEPASQAPGDGSARSLSI